MVRLRADFQRERGWAVIGPPPRRVGRGLWEHDEKGKAHRPFMYNVMVHARCALCVRVTFGCKISETKPWFHVKCVCGGLAGRGPGADGDGCPDPVAHPAAAADNGLHQAVRGALRRLPEATRGKSVSLIAGRLWKSSSPGNIRVRTVAGKRDGLVPAVTG